VIRMLTQKTFVVTLLLTVAFAVSVAIAVAQDAVDPITQESIDKCKATATTKPTAKMIVEKVDAACALLEKEGLASLPKFKGKDSEFIFAGTYIWINSADEGIMTMHPIKPKMEGRPLVESRDANGKQFFAEMNKLVREKGSGWVEYMWPKPGEKEPSLKISYVKAATIDGKKYTVGCGVYGMTIADVEKELGPVNK
jgi:cytochrome c